MTVLRLAELLSVIPGWVDQDLPALLITGVTPDSRQVQPGNLFVAVSGGSTDGHRYIPNAIQAGAVAIVGAQECSGLGVPYVRVSDSRRALAHLAAAWHGFPARRMTMIGVTGTDGKTTTATLIFHILKAAGLRAGMISTVSAVIGDEALDTGFHVTTPDAMNLQVYLQRMAQAGLTHAILEATSHGLAQQRVAACDFDMAVVTNITHEHLDYHGTYQAYRQAKGLLFSGLAESPLKSINPPRGAVLNRDDSSFDYLVEITAVPTLSYGLTPLADVRACQLVNQPAGLDFDVDGRDLSGVEFHLSLSSPLVGDYNVYNCLAAIALARGIMGLDAEAIKRGLADFPGVPGRMERIDMGQDFTAIVDFAHTPFALRSALQAARQLTQGRLIAVFGSAGLRDRLKRRMMAETAAELADLSLLTAEDPRTESLSGILQEMVEGVQARGGVEGQTFWRLPDRREALRFAVRLARPGDLVIACGKGHELSMCFGETEYPWDDRVALRAALAERLSVPGPVMPDLPEV